MPQPSGERSSGEEVERGEGRASNKLRTAMVGMGAGGDYMNKGEEEEVIQEDAEA